MGDLRILKKIILELAAPGSSCRFQAALAIPMYAAVPSDNFPSYPNFSDLFALSQ